MGGKIIITGSRGLIGSAVTTHLKAQGREVLELDLSLGHDLSNEAFVKEWFQKNHGQYLINLFALNDHVESARSKIDIFSVSLESVRAYVETNLVSLFSVCRSFAAANPEGGGIVNFSSTYGVVSPRKDIYDGSEKHIGYSISKGGVMQLTRHLAVHLAPKFRVNCVFPGGVQKNQPESFQKKYAAHTPMGRMMHVTELNSLMEYLCSD
ncbi:MAG: SDR family oxidoreductase, partial [Bdellovibrionota bacterium]